VNKGQGHSMVVKDPPLPLEKRSRVSKGDVLSGLRAGDVQTDLGRLTFKLER